MADMNARILALEKKAGGTDEVYEGEDGTRYYLREGARYIVSSPPGVKEEDCHGYDVKLVNFEGNEGIDAKLARIRAMKRVR